LAHLFTGTYSRSLDSKKRLLVPSEIRDVLSVEDRQGLFLIPTKRCVFLWPRSFADAYAEQQGADPFSNLGFNRSFYSRMIFRQFDGTGRIVLPGEVADRFPKRQVLIAGAGRYVELWNPDDFEQAVEPLDFE